MVIDLDAISATLVENLSREGPEMLIPQKNLEGEPLFKPARCTSSTIVALVCASSDYPRPSARGFTRHYIWYHVIGLAMCRAFRW